jgi:hypothetical protein
MNLHSRENLKFNILYALLSVSATIPTEKYLNCYGILCT